MGPDQLETSENLLFLVGLYSRVARLLGVHPSYVSRVARGERRSDRVYRAIVADLAKLRGEDNIVPTEDASLRESRLNDMRKFRSQLVSSMRSESRLRRLNVVVIEESDRTIARSELQRISPAAPSAKVAANARLLAASVAAFDRMSLRLERFPHVLSLLDPDAVVLFSTGTTSMVRKEFRTPGFDWSQDHRGPSAAARSLAAGVPIVGIGAIAIDEDTLPVVRMACPVRPSDNFITGAIVLTIEMKRSRAEHMLELSRVAKKLCRFVENGAMEPPKRSARFHGSQPFRDAARKVAMVPALPQIDPHTRVASPAFWRSWRQTARTWRSPRFTVASAQA